MGQYNLDKERSGRRPKNIKTGTPSDGLEIKEKYKNTPNTPSDWLENDDKQGIPEKTSWEDREKIRAKKLKSVVRDKQKEALSADAFSRGAFAK